jgi:hypothetical protein
MRRLVAAGMVPDRAGQPAKVVAHISLPDLIGLDTGAALTAQWTEAARARWAAARGAAAQHGGPGGDGGVRLDGGAARGFACDAGITPVVAGEVNLAALEALVRLCAELGGHGPGRCQPRRTPGGGSPGGAEDTTGSGPAGAGLGGPSLPLDVGWSQNIPAAIRNAVLIRDRHRRWPGGCTQPARACHAHHVRHKGRGGKTSLQNCVLLCAFHHLVAIHRWGWTLALNGDGTTTA